MADTLTGMIDVYEYMTSTKYSNSSFGSQEDLDSFLECLTMDEQRKKRTKELLEINERACLEALKYVSYIDYRLPPFDKELMEWCDF